MRRNPLSSWSRYKVSVYAATSASSIRQFTITGLASPKLKSRETGSHVATAIKWTLYYNFSRLAFVSVCFVVFSLALVFLATRNITSTVRNLPVPSRHAIPCPTQVYNFEFINGTT